MYKLKTGICELLTEDIVETLKTNQYLTVMEFCTDKPELIAEKCKIPLKDIVAIQRLLLAKNHAKLTCAVDIYHDIALTGSGIKTGIEGLESLLNGGIFWGEFVEFFGDAASGKTQVCFNIAAHASVIGHQDVLYIDSCGSFSAERIREIIINNVPEQKAMAALSRIHCLPCFDVYDLLEKLDDLLESVTQKSKHFPRVIIIDSIANVLLPSLGGPTMQGHGLMNRIANKLKTLAVTHKNVIVTTNNLVKWEGSEPYPGLGKFWSHVPNVRIKLWTPAEEDPLGPHRMAEIKKAVRTATGKCVKIKLTSRGVETPGPSSFLRSLKEYKPPPDVNQQICRICADLLNLKDTRSIKNVVLTDRSMRFKILTKCIGQLDHDIPNSQLHKINTIGDLVNYFNVPVKTTTSMEDLKHSADLPPNLHIQHEYIRFHPDTDTMFGGISAFPRSPTIVTGLKARKKYKGYKVKTSVYDLM